MNPVVPCIEGEEHAVCVNEIKQRIEENFKWHVANRAWVADLFEAHRNEQAAAALLDHLVWLPQLDKSVRKELQNRCKRYEEQTLKAFPYQLKEGRIRSGTEVIPSVAQPIVPERPTDVNLPCYLVAIPMLMSLNTGKAIACHDALISKIAAQAFGANEEESLEEVKKRLTIVIGVNRMKSLDSAENTQFSEAMERLCKTHLVCCRTFGCLWDPWLPKREDPYLFSAQKSFFLVKLLSNGRLSERLQERFKERVQIPYQSIRNWILHHEETQKVIDYFHEKENPCYLASMDDDVISLRSGQEGLYTHYDRIISEWKKETPPQLLSTGYFLSEGEPKALRLAMNLDMRVRGAMSDSLPLTTYFPEPNFVFLIPRDAKVFKECTYFGAGSDMEGARLVQNGVKAKAITHEGSLFRPIPALTTSTPNRFKKQNLNQDIKTVEELGSIEMLKAIRDLSQSHVNPKVWCDNVYPFLPKQDTKETGRGIAGKIKKCLYRLRQPFDPIYLLVNGHLAYHSDETRNFLAMIENYPKISGGFHSFLNWFLNEKAEKELPESTHLRSIDKLLGDAVEAEGNLIKLGFKEVEVQRLVEVSFATGNAIFKVLKEEAEALL